MKHAQHFSAVVFGFLTIAYLAPPAFGQRGRLDYGQITSAALTNNLLGDSPTRRYIAYLPPSYDSAQKRYPVVYVLHGYTGDETTLVGALTASLDLLIQYRQIGEMIAIFVNGNNRLNGSFYLSSAVIGDFETYITSDLVGYVDSRYRTLATRQSRAIHGMSMGGWGAMHLALKFPDRFNSVVAESGWYDSRSIFLDSLERQLASAHPTNLTQFSSLLAQSPPYLASVQALLCGLLPDPERPRLYSDYVYDWTNSQPSYSAAADARCRTGDVQNGDLERYTNQPVRLAGIKVVHGTADGVVPIVEARNFTNALTAAGVPFAYEEHSGGHDYHPELALPFLSTNLLGAQLYVAPPQVTLAVTASSIQLFFATQLGVQYWIESTSTLLNGTSNWNIEANLTGTGRVTKISLSATPNVRFYRVTAANVP